MKGIKLVWRYLTDEWWRTQLILQKWNQVESKLNNHLKI
jgi:hypothetical protein